MASLITSFFFSQESLTKISTVSEKPNISSTPTYDATDQVKSSSSINRETAVNQQSKNDVKQSTDDEMKAMLETSAQIEKMRNEIDIESTVHHRSKENRSLIHNKKSIIFQEKILKSIKVMISLFS